jgi:hypothetical protein
MAEVRGKGAAATVQVGEVVVLVEDVDGIKAGHEGRIMSLRDNMVMVGCRSRDRLQLVLAHTWEVLPQELFRRLCKRERGLDE